MNRKRKFRLRFTIRQILIAAVIFAVYLACRNLALTHADQRFLWIVAPLFAGIVLSAYVAITKGRYLAVLVASIVGPLFALLIWAIEIRAETEPSLLDDVPTDLATLAFFIVAFAVPTAFVSFAVGVALRFGLDNRVSVPVRTIATGFLVAAYAGLAYSGYYLFNDPAFRYRVLDDDHSFRDALANEIENGDSIEHVVQVLGEGMHRKERSWVEIQMLSKDDPVFLERYPDGIEVDDVFIAYSDFPNQYILQFRDGKVINLDTEWLQKHYGDASK